MMETVCLELRKRLKHDPHVQGALVLFSGDSFSVPEPVDLFLLVFYEQVRGEPVLTYIKDIWKIKELRIPVKGLTAEVIAGDRQEVIDCLLRGEILYDPKSEIAGFRNRLLMFPQELKRKKMCLEFSGLLKAHLESKLLLKEGHLLDAYFSIQKSLLHWARLAAIESGEYPRFRLWSQVKPIHPGVYKLYRELTIGEESLEKRMRLVLLAEEYSVLTKPEHYCMYLLQLLTMGGESWSLSEIHDHLERDEFTLDVTLVMEELVRRAWVEEVIFNGPHMEQRYRLIRKYH